MNDPGSDKKKRTRSSTPRVRTGCQTCRKRRIKCDEAKPSCLRCTRSGWKCDGYTTQQPTSTAITTSKTCTPLLTITRYALPFRLPGPQKDRQLLHYFIVQGSQQLAGSLNLDFWTRTVFEQCHQEPTVRHALVSLSSLHLDCTTAALGVAREETLALYGKALRMLQKRMRTSDAQATRTALVCSILFYCFEATLGNSEAATYHLQGGLNVLASCRGQRAERVDELSGIALEFESLDLQATLYYDLPIPDLPFPQHSMDDGTLSMMPLKRLSDAHRALVKLIYRAYCRICGNLDHKLSPTELIPEPVLQRKLDIQQGLARWKVEFDSLRSQLGDSEKARQACQTLLVHWHLGSMLNDAVCPADPSVWGASPNLRAKEVLQLIDEILKDDARDALHSPSSKSPQRVVSSEIGVIAPLFVLALKCADQEVSDHAYELLSSTQRREGLWEASHLASLIWQLREVRERRVALGGKAALKEAKSQSLEQLFARELASPMQKLDLKSNQFEQIVKGLYGTSVIE